MSNSNNVVLERHLDSLAAAISAEITIHSGSGGGSGGNYADFTGATSIAGGTNGLVPAPAAGDQIRFLRGDGVWGTPANTGSGIALDSVASDIEGGLWRAFINDAPVLKLRHGDYEYNFNYDSTTLLPSESSPPATVEPDTYILGTASVSSEGGLWYEIDGTYAKLKYRSGSFIYGLNPDSTTYKGGNSNLVSYLPFDYSLTEDLCGNEWTASGAATIENGKLALNGGVDYVQTTAISLGGQDFTADCWMTPTNLNDWRAFLYISGFSNGEMGACGGTALAPRLSQNLGNYPNTFSVNTRTHLAIVYKHDSSTLAWFVDGTKKHEAENVSFSRTPLTIKIGNGFGLNYFGYFDHFRVFDGQALWTSNFTPPTASDYL